VKDLSTPAFLIRGERRFRTRARGEGVPGRDRKPQGQSVTPERKNFARTPRERRWCERARRVTRGLTRRCAKKGGGKYYVAPEGRKLERNPHEDVNREKEQREREWDRSARRRKGERDPRAPGRKSGLRGP